MSFQDVGKPGARGRQQQQQQQRVSHLTAQPYSSIPEGRTSLTKGDDPFAQLSDGILQYQRNVGILEKIIRQIGTPTDGPELETQYDVQVDVLQQLGAKLETNLSLQESQLAQVPSRTEASKRRATLVKLNRDYRRVEAVYKSMVLDTKRRKAQRAQLQLQQNNNNARARDTDTSSGYGTTANQQEMSQEEQRMQLELQLQTDRLNEEIMRERESEIRNINKGMHQVNEIYKDLAHIVGNQQEQVDQIEGQMEESKSNAEQGLGHIQKANEKANASQCTIS